MRAETLQLYRSLLNLGPMQYSEIQAMLRLGERTTLDLLGQMASERLIVVNDDRQVTISLPRHCVVTFFPDLL